MPRGAECGRDPGSSTLRTTYMFAYTDAAPERPDFEKARAHAHGGLHAVRMGAHAVRMGACSAGAWRAAHSGRAAQHRTTPPCTLPPPPPQLLDAYFHLLPQYQGVPLESLHFK